MKIRGIFSLWIIWSWWEWATRTETILTYCKQVRSKPKLNNNSTHGCEAPAITAWLKPLVALQREDRGSIKNEAAICGNGASSSDASGFNPWLHNVTAKPFKHAKPLFSLCVGNITHSPWNDCDSQRLNGKCCWGKCHLSYLCLSSSPVPHIFSFQLRTSLCCNKVFYPAFFSLEVVPDNANAFCSYGTILLAIIFEKNID